MNAQRDQGIVERFNLTLGERLFTFQYSQEMNFKEGKRPTEWVKGLPEVIVALCSEVTRLTGKKPVDAIKDKSVDAKSSTTYLRPVGLKEKSLDGSKNVRYLYVTGELEGGQRRATDPVWSPVWSSISKNHLWIKVSLYSTIWKMDQSVVSSEKSFRLVHLELSCLLKEFIDLKIKKNEFLNSLKQS